MKLVRAFIWVLLSLVFVAMAGMVVRIGVALVLPSIDTWQRLQGARSSIAATKPMAWGYIMGSVVEQLVVVLVIAFLWFKAFRWLRRTRNLPAQQPQVQPH